MYLIPIFLIVSDDSIVFIFCNQFRATLEGTLRNLAWETRFLIQIHVIVGTKKHQKNAAFSVAKEIDFSTPIVFLPKVQRIAKINSRIICKAFRNHNQSLSGRWRFQNFFFCFKLEWCMARGVNDVVFFYSGRLHQIVTLITSLCLLFG